MKKEPEQIKMKLDIGLQRLYIKVPFDRQDFARDVESEMNKLYDQWRRDFTAKSDTEILAMVAYRFASFYMELDERYREATEKAAHCDALLDKALSERTAHTRSISNPDDGHPRNPGDADQTEDEQDYDDGDIFILQTGDL